MQQFQVDGMSCAACSTRVEKAVSAVPGVRSCSVSLLTNSMGVEGDVDIERVIRAVKEAGYHAKIKGGNIKENQAEEVLTDRETPVLKKRLISSVAFLLVLMYFSMGAHMWGWPLPDFFEQNPLAQALVQLLLTSAVLVINQKFFVSGFRALAHRAPNMDSLVALGSSAAFVYSCYSLFLMSDAAITLGAAAAQHYMADLYFESAAMILSLITVGKMLEARSKGKTTDALKSLMELAPQSAVVLREGREVSIPVEELGLGEIFLVRPGESIPVDGVVLEGSSTVNEAALTGESMPVDKQAGDHVSAATINLAGFIKCCATRVGEDTTLAQIIKMVSDAAATKAPIAKVADRVSGVFVPVVMVIAVLTATVWMIIGESFAFSLARGISVLVISCPCALGLATPVAIMVGSGLGARKGILFKTAESLEESGKLSIIALDKTGTVTTGEMHVTDLWPWEGCDEKQLLTVAYSLELKSEHPLAGAIVRKAEQEKMLSLAVSDFAVLPGNGLSGVMDGHAVYGGNARFISGKISLPEAAVRQAELLAEQGKTPLYFGQDGQLLGLIAVADQMKEDSAEAVRQLKDMGLRVVMLTGDNERTAKAIGVQAGIDEVIAGVLPEGKEQVIRQLSEQGKTAMVGDGINDAPALTRADIGIAIGAGTDVAMDAADVVLMKSSLLDVPAAIRLSRAALKNIHQNLFWAFFYNAIGIPLAAGAFVALGLTLNPMFAAAAMSLSSFFVVSNALRLNLFDPYQTKQNKQKEIIIQEDEKAMEKTLKIEGMMCPHCEARVKKCLEALPGVTKAEVSHAAGTAVVTLSDAMADEVLKAAVEAQDYKVISIQ